MEVESAEYEGPPPRPGVPTTPNWKSWLLLQVSMIPARCQSADVDSIRLDALSRPVFQTAT